MPAVFARLLRSEGPLSPPCRWRIFSGRHVEEVLPPSQSLPFPVPFPSSLSTAPDCGFLFSSADSRRSASLFILMLRWSQVGQGAAASSCFCVFLTHSHRFFFFELCRLPSTRYLRSSCILFCPSSGTSRWRKGPRVRSAAAGVKLGSGCRHTCPAPSPLLGAQTWAVCARVLRGNTDVCACVSCAHTGLLAFTFLFVFCL